MLQLFLSFYRLINIRVFFKINQFMAIILLSKTKY